MKWENLKTFQCPHCDKDLKQDGDHVNCIQCRFTIDYERYKSILTHRSSPEAASIVRYKWQNLKENRCILCGNFLREAGTQYKILKCMTSSCTFKISESTLTQYLNDKTHPVNRFYNAVAEQEKNQSKLNNLK